MTEGHRHIRASGSFLVAQEWAPVRTDPQVTAELADQQCDVPASSKWDVKADSMTPAFLN
jgi:hypothetical protein